MTLFDLVRLCLMKLHRKPRYTSARHSVSTPLGLKSYRDVNTQAALDEGIKRAKRVKCYSPKVGE